MCCYTTLWNVNVRKLLYTIQSLMVSVGMSQLGCTHLIFIDPGMKVNSSYYRELLLSQQLLPAIWQVSGDFFVFQQDSAPAHRARKTIKLLQWETPAFISANLWPPNSPDLNPVDYEIWGVMQDRVYQKNEGRERVERATGWGQGRTATERDWRCHRPCSGADACVPAFGLEKDILSLCCDCISYLGYGSWSSLKIYR